MNPLFDEYAREKTNPWMTDECNKHLNKWCIISELSEWSWDKIGQTLFKVPVILLADRHRSKDVCGE